MAGNTHGQAEEEATVYWLEPTLTGKLRAAAAWLVALASLYIGVTTGPAGFPHGPADAQLTLLLLQLALLFMSRLSRHNRRAWGPYEPGWGSKVYLVELLAMGITFAVTLLMMVTRLLDGWLWLSAPLVALPVLLLCASPILVFGLLAMRVGRPGR